MRLNHRMVNLSLLIFEFVLSAIGLLYFVVTATDFPAQRGLMIFLPIAAALIVAAWRNWRWTNVINVLIASLLTVTLLVNPVTDHVFAPIVFAPMALALVITSATWTGIVALGVLGTLIARAGGQGTYSQIDNIISYVFIAGCLYIGRRLLEQAQINVTDALNNATNERLSAEHYAREARQHAATLEERTTDQQRLLDTLVALETPAIEVAEHVLLAPIVGYLEPHRVEALIRRLLHDIADRRVHTLLLDISGLTLVDARVAATLDQLTQAVRLLGANVIISGITPQSATVLSEHAVNLHTVTISPTPYTALKLVQQSI